MRFDLKGPLDEVGQQSEQVRERINHLSMRLDELKTLADDFGHIVQPVHDFVQQHTHTQAKLLETDALLTREREVSSATRAELNDLHGVAARLSGDLAAATADLRGHEARLREQDASLTQTRLRIEDQNAIIDNLERQLDAEVERTRTLGDDNQVLRSEIESLDQFRSRAEGDLTEGARAAQHRQQRERAPAAARREPLAAHDRPQGPDPRARAADPVRPAGDLAAADQALDRAARPPEGRGDPRGRALRPGGGDQFA